MSHVLAFGHHCETPVSRTSPTDQHMLVAMPAPVVCTERWLGWCFSRSDTLFLCHRLWKFNLGILLGPQSKKIFAVAKFELELSLSSVGQPSAEPSTANKQQCLTVLRMGTCDGHAHLCACHGNANRHPSGHVIHCLWTLWNCSKLKIFHCSIIKFVDKHIIKTLLGQS